MKLSDAIEAGAKFRPQAFGAYFIGSTRADACSCVFGGLYEFTFKGVSLSHDAVVAQFDNLCARYPILLGEEKHFCPEGAGVDVAVDNLPNILIHLNDDHRWTREQIAEYVRQLEN